MGLSVSVLVEGLGDGFFTTWLIINEGFCGSVYSLRRVLSSSRLVFFSSRLVFVSASQFLVSSSSLLLFVSSSLRLVLP